MNPSVSSCRIRRARPPPIAWRIAISRLRLTPCASIMLARLRHEISSTTPARPCSSATGTVELMVVARRGADVQTAERPGDHRLAGILRRIRLFHPLRNRRQVAVGRLDGRARTQPADQQQAVIVATSRASCDCRRPAPTRAGRAPTAARSSPARSRRSCRRSRAASRRSACKGRPFRTTVRPRKSPAKPLRAHIEWLAIATKAGAPGRSSAAVNVRPSTGATPRVSKKLAETTSTIARRVVSVSVTPAIAMLCAASWLNGPAGVAQVGVVGIGEGPGAAVALAFDAVDADQLAGDRTGRCEAAAGGC